MADLRGLAGDESDVRRIRRDRRVGPVVEHLDVAETGRLEQELDVRCRVPGYHDRSGLDDELVAPPRGSLHLHRDPLLEWVEVDDTRAEPVLVSLVISGPPAVVEVLGQLRSTVLRPVAPSLRIGVRHLVVEDEKAAGVEVMVDSREGLPILLSGPPDAHRAAAVDRSYVRGRSSSCIGYACKFGVNPSRW